MTSKESVKKQSMKSSVLQIKSLWNYQGLHLIFFHLVFLRRIL